MYVSGGRLWNYPGGQARYGLQNLNTYRITEDVFYLHRAAAQAQRLLATHISVNGAWFYPLRFSRYRHSKVNNGELMKPPWYGGMAQGGALSLMVRMYEVTGEARYLAAAKATLNSFLRMGPATGPWVVNLDGAQRLWIQEWPRLPLDYTYNGHMIATYGLHDYYSLTGDTLALLLFRAAASAALDYAPKFRRPGSISRYCLLHGTPNEKYHGVHISCLRHLAVSGRYSTSAASALAVYSGEEAFRRWSEIYLGLLRLERPVGSPVGRRRPARPAVRRRRPPAVSLRLKRAPRPAGPTTRPPRQTNRLTVERRMHSSQAGRGGVASSAPLRYSPPTMSSAPVTQFDPNARATAGVRRCAALRARRARRAPVGGRLRLS